MDYLRQMLAMERDKRTRDQKTIAKQAKTIAMLSDHVERVMGAMRSYVEAKLASDTKAKQLRTATHRLRTVIDKQQLSIRVHQQLIASLRDTGTTMERQLFDMDRRYGDMKNALQQLRKHHAEALATATAHSQRQSQIQAQAPIQVQSQPQQYQQQERRMKRVDSLRSATNRQPVVPTVPTVVTGGAPPEGVGKDDGSEQYGSESFEEASRQEQVQGQVTKQKQQAQRQIQVQMQGQGPGVGQVRAEESIVSEELFLNSPDAKVSARVVATVVCECVGACECSL